MAGTVKAAITDVTKTFVDDRQPTDPFHDPKTRELYPDVSAKLSYYRSNDPTTNRKEVMLPLVFWKIYKAAFFGSAHDQATAFLLIKAIFFALRSYEYSQTPQVKT